jgi:hypothetical protein
MVPTSTRMRLGGLAVLCALCLALTGCNESKVTKANFDKIKNGMTLKEVQAILGEGSRQGDGSLVANQVGVDLSGGAPPSSTTDYVWENGKKKITITFSMDKVVGKTSSGL